MLRTKLNSFPKFMKDEGLKLAGDTAIADIRESTAKGVDPAGISYQEYSERYKKLKKRLTGAFDPVNLRLTGDMMKGLMYFRRTDHSGYVTTKAKDDYKLAGVSRLRPFLMKSNPMIAHIKQAEIDAFKAFIR